jgi:putative zinc finger protein
MTKQPDVTCARVRVLLEPYVDGDLAVTDPALALAVRHHLAGCADCRRQHDQAVSVPFRLQALAAPEAPGSLVGDVMGAVGAQRQGYRRAWTLLAPEAVLAAFILWYLSGLDGLGSIASGIFDDLQGMAAGSLPAVPQVDVVLLVAAIALTSIAGYHLSILIRIAPKQVPAAMATSRHA